MSFKREGNDKGLLDNLRRRRIKELFAEDIPEDEAKLLCNGRFACLVCTHNPIFDTVNMLMVHRQGKKHAAGEAEFLRKKKELRALILKRKHEQYMKDGTTNIRQAPSTSSGSINTARPYDPRVKKQKVKPYDRKPRLDVLPSDPVSPSESPRQESSIGASHSAAFSGDLPSKHSHQLKNIFRLPQRPELPFQPYVSHRQESFNSDPLGSLQSPSMSQSVVSSEMCLQTATPSLAERDAYTTLNHPCATSSSSGPHLNANQPVLSSTNQRGAKRPHVSGSVSKGKNFVNCVSGGVASLAAGTAVCAGSSAGFTEGKRSPGCAKQSKTGSVDKNNSVGATGSGCTQSLAQKYHQLGGSGWKRDWDGKWIRDEQAEFDSDEEPPDLP